MLWLLSPALRAFIKYFLTCPRGVERANAERLQSTIDLDLSPWEHELLMTPRT